MSDYVTTPNYGLYKPVPNADNDVWGDHWNSNADTLDAALAAIALTAGVATFNGRTGAVTLSANDVNAVVPPAAAVPLMDGAATIGTSGHWAQADHVHPSDTSRAPLASPAFTGNPTAPTQATTDSSTKLASTAFVQAAAASGPALNNFGRNLLHNSLFNVAQRGAGPWSVVGYTFDRWGLSFSNDTISISVVNLADTDRAAIGDESAWSALQATFTGNAAAGAYSQMVQPVEGVLRLSGKTVTMSFWAKASAALKLGVNITQLFGSGGSPSSPAYGTPVAVTLSTSWARYTATIAVPSAAGKTFGTNPGSDYTQCALWLSSGSTYNAHAGNIGVQSGTVELWGVQLEIGSVATPLEKRDPMLELALCQRFYQIGQIVLLAYANAASMPAGQTIALPVFMRSAATFTTANQGNANIGAVSMSMLAGGMVYMSAPAIGAGAVTFNTTFTASADL